MDSTEIEITEEKINFTWFDTQLFLLAKGTPMARMGYSEIFECLPKEKQKELTDKKVEFARVA